MSKSLHVNVESDGTMLDRTMLDRVGTNGTVPVCVYHTSNSDLCTPCCSVFLNNESHFEENMAGRASFINVEMLCMDTPSLTLRRSCLSRRLATLSHTPGFSRMMMCYRYSCLRSAHYIYMTKILLHCTCNMEISNS